MEDTRQARDKVDDAKFQSDLKIAYTVAVAAIRTFAEL